MNYPKLLHVFLWLAIFCTSAIAQEDRVIRVSGTGTISTKPDRARIHMRVSALDVSIVSGKRAVDEKVGDVQKMLLDFGVKPIDINTSSLSVFEERNDQINPDGSGKVAKQEMYRINRDIISQIEDITKLDVILDNALKLGTNSIQNVEFYSGNADELRFTALEKASEDARKKAEFLANRFGCKLGEARQIEYDYKGQGPQFYGVASAGFKGGGSLSFLQGGVDVTATVNVEYEIK